MRTQTPMIGVSTRGYRMAPFNLKVSCCSKNIVFARIAAINARAPKFFATAPMLVFSLKSAGFIEILWILLQHEVWLLLVVDRLEHPAPDSSEATWRNSASKKAVGCWDWMNHDNFLTFCLALPFISLFWRCQSGYLAQNNVSCLKTKERFWLAENLRITCSSASVFSKVLAACKINLTTASARKN